MICSPDSCVDRIALCVTEQGAMSSCSDLDLNIQRSVFHGFLCGGMKKVGTAVCRVLSR
jgi:hypothetical protein